MTEFVKVAGVETPVEVAQILNKIIDEKGNVDLDNLSEVGEKRFSDLSSSITNVKNSVSSLTTTVNGKIGATVSKAANGYIKFTNGVILQYLKNVSIGSGANVKFPISFSSSNYAISTCHTFIDGEMTNVNIMVTHFSANSAYIKSSSSSTTCSIIVIGY